MKRALLPLALAAALAFPAAPVFTVPAAAADAAGTKSLLMVLWRVETEYDVAFKERLAELGVNVRIEERIGDGTRATLAGILRDHEKDFATGTYDLIYSWGTTGTRMAKIAVNGRAPIVFNVVFDPEGSQIVPPHLATGEREDNESITGVTNGVPMETQFEGFRSLFPLGRLCLLFNAREHNANLVLDRVERWAATNGTPFQALRVAPDTSLLDDHLRDIAAGLTRCDTVYAGADAYLGSKAEEIDHAIGDRIKLVGGTARFVENGWLAAVAPSVTSMGHAAAELAAKILAGAPARTLPVVLPPPELVISESAAARHGIPVPESAKKAPEGRPSGAASPPGAKPDAAVVALPVPGNGDAG